MTKREIMELHAQAAEADARHLARYAECRGATHFDHWEWAKAAARAALRRASVASLGGAR